MLKSFLFFILFAFFLYKQEKKYIPFFKLFFQVFDGCKYFGIIWIWFYYFRKMSVREKKRLLLHGIMQTFKYEIFIIRNYISAVCFPLTHWFPVWQLKLNLHPTNQPSLQLIWDNAHNIWGAHISVNVWCNRRKFNIRNILWEK